MRKTVFSLVSFALGAALAGSALAQDAQDAGAQDSIARGAYLVNLGGCNDCHTPGALKGHPDMTRFLAGSDVGFGIPNLGVFPGRNLTPDKETGLGNWTEQQIVTAFTTGVRPNGVKLAPVMPYRDFVKLTSSDAHAVAKYLMSIKPVHNEVPGPFGPSQKPKVFVMTPLPPDVYESLPKPGGH